MRSVKNTCCYCGVGCGVVIETAPDAVHGARITTLRGDSEHPANYGRLCTKGSTLHLSAAPEIYAQARGQNPELRRQRTADRQAASWDEVNEYVAESLVRIVRQHGPDAIGFYLSGQLLTEDYYVFNKLGKGLVGTNNVDSNSRLCMSSAVAGYKQSLGSDAPPCCYEDIDLADTLFITGSNTAYAHPILFRRIESARQQNPERKLVVVDVRETDTARTADLFLKILPGTDVALHHGMLHVMIARGWIDPLFIAQHTEGFEALAARVAEFTPALAAGICGIREEDLIEAARLFACSRSTLSLYCQGLNQSSSGTDKNTSLINLHLATAQIGKPGAGPFSLTGQPNAMGGREVGAMANLLSAHRDLANPQDRAEIAALWGVPSIPEQAGLTAVPMFDALRAGQLKAVWIVCTNPAQSLPNQTLVREALERAELVIVQDAYANTATVQYADVFLPATTWAEKDGTVTNSERRISRVSPALPPYKNTRHDWRIAVDIAQRMEALLRPVDQAHLFPYTSAEDIWNEHRATTRGRDLDIGGLSYAMLERDGPQQWPLPAGASSGKKRLYEDRRFATPNGHARFTNPAYLSTAEETDARFPFALTTGRLRDQWHGMSRTGTLARLFAHAPQPAVQINPADAQRLGLENAELVYVTSRRGSQIFPVEIAEGIAPSQAFIAMHWGEEYVSGLAGRSPGYGVNSLIAGVLDPFSKQPELKHAAIKLVKGNLPWHLVAFGKFAGDQAVAVQNVLRSLSREHPDACAFRSAVLFGRENEKSEPGPGETSAPDRPSWLGVQLRMASLEPFEPQLLNEIQAIFQVNRSGVLSYQDKRNHALKKIGLQQLDDGQVLLQSCFLTGKAQEIDSRHWLRDLLEGEANVRAIVRQLVSASKSPPSAAAPRGKIVCNCFNTASVKIEETLATLPDETPEGLVIALKNRLGCGGNCGSCLPELTQMAKNHLAAVRPPV